VTADAYAVAAVRSAEAAVLAAVPEGSLMQRAAAGLAVVCARELQAREPRGRRGRVTGARAVLLVGSGDNGGDALWAGARLAARGARVDALLLAPQVHAEGLAALRAAGGRVHEVSGRSGADLDAAALDAVALDAVALDAVARGVLGRADLVVDGVVGLGGSPGLREPAASVVAALDALDPRPVVVAVDLPSGVDPDGGARPAACVRADVTVTFGALKPGLLLPPAARAAGRVELVDLGLGPHLPPRPDVDRLTPADAARRWPVPGPDDDKYSRGVVGIVAGSQLYTGAAVLATGGALRAGAGMVRYVGPPHPTERVRARWPEAVTGPGRVQAWAVGSGVDPEEPDGDPGSQVHAVLDVLREAAGRRLPVVVDAGALAVLARPGVRDLAGDHLLLTPHAGELARLLGAWTGTAVARDDVQARPLDHVRAAVAATGATVLLKGSVTVIASPDGRVRTQAGAPGWLATAGAGDVLAGVTATLLAAGLDPLDAAGLAALVHGLAAALASGGPARGPAGGIGSGAPGGPIVAEDVVTALPDAVRALLAGASSTGRGTGPAPSRGR